LKSLVGTVVAGKYRLDRILGKGGMGVVYEATNQSVGRRVALKRLWAGDDPDLVGRLHREARATAAIHSPHVVEILDVVKDEHEEIWVVMELLEGESLAARIQRFGSLSAAETAAFVAQLLAGLEAAHEQHVVHRDLKPANVFLHRSAEGETVVKLLDFGISKWRGETGGQLTATGATLGTPSYMAPEQAQASRDADERSDVYSVGAILYECLSGEPPYGRDTYPVVLARLMTQDPVDIGDLVPDLGPGLVDVIRRAMARDPADRFPTAHSMRVALESSVDLTAPRSISTPRRRPGADGSPAQTAEPAATPFAAESMRVERRRPPLGLLGAGLAVGMLAAIAWLVLWDTPAAPPASPALTATPLPSPVAPLARTAPPPVPAVAAPTVPPPVAAPAMPAVPSPRRLRVLVTPEEARARVVVALGSGVELASTGSPAAFTLAEGDEALSVTVRAAGFREARRELAPTDVEVEIALERNQPVRRNHGPTIDDRNPLRR